MHFGNVEVIVDEDSFWKQRLTQCWTRICLLKLNDEVEEAVAGTYQEQRMRVMVEQGWFAENKRLGLTYGQRFVLWKQAVSFPTWSVGQNSVTWSPFGRLSCLVNTGIHGEWCHVVSAFFDCEWQGVNGNSSCCLDWVRVRRGGCVL